MEYEIGQEVWVMVDKSTECWVHGVVTKLTDKRVKVDTQGIRPDNTYFAKHNVTPKN